MGYAFTNCTQCGPRYTIVESLPYDRPRTTMRSFRMCADCRREYKDPSDRRFHAQPIACPVCGPRLTLLDRRGRRVAGDPIDVAAAALSDGKVV
ncbi:MAG: carbamoyltransferase HypF, partial [candidate division WOR-3 bacterium]